jgi:hypothetical protein
MTNFVVEDFCGGARQRAQTVVAQHCQIVTQSHTGQLNAEHNFHGRECMDVHTGNGRLHGA